MSNITLIGMAGAGKSTIGNNLSDYLDMSFVDTDFLIYKHENLSLPDIIENKGEPYFRKIEAECILGLNPVNTVISTGGSAVLNENIMNHLKGISSIVYLYADYRTIEARMTGTQSRKIIYNGNNSLKDVYGSRLELYYRYADISVNSGFRADIVLESIIEGLKIKKCMN